MFSNLNKPAFGASTASTSFGFGASSSSNQAPFGQSQLFGKPGTTSGFGTGTPLFGATSQQSGTPLFTNTSVQSFGAAAQQSGFGSGLFGQQQTIGGNGLFTNPSTSTFGQNKSAGFGFAPSTSAPLFGQPQTTNFQPSTSSGVFSSTNAFGGTNQMGTVIKFNPVTGTDTMQKSGITHSISTKHHCITCMKEYEAKSLEELRWEDYQCNRRAGPQQQSGFGAAPFGVPTSSAPSMFGQPEQSKPPFGQPNTFGPATGGFGGFGTPATTSAFGFNTATPTFGTNAGIKPFGSQPNQNVFGPTTTQSTGFGNTFFGQQNAQNTSSFFNKPAPSAFNNQQAPLFIGQQPTTQSSFFQPPKSTTGFGTFGQANLPATSGFGPQSNIFSQSPQNPFNAFQKPAQPTFNQSLQTGFAIGTQPTGTNFFGNANKTAFPGVVGVGNQNSFFSPPAGGFIMPQQQQAIPNMAVNYETPQQDFRAIVENIYDPFPRYDFLAGLKIKKPPLEDTTNPIAIKEIIEKATAPISTTDDVGKMRIIPKPKHPGYYSAARLSLLDDVLDATTSHTNYLLRTHSGKRLVINPNKKPLRTIPSYLEDYEKVLLGIDDGDESANPDGQSLGLFKNPSKLADDATVTSGISPLSPKEIAASPVYGKLSTTTNKSSTDKRDDEGQQGEDRLIKDIFSIKKFGQSPFIGSIIDKNSTVTKVDEGTQTTEKMKPVNLYPILNMNENDSMSEKPEMITSNIQTDDVTELNLSLSSRENTNTDSPRGIIKNSGMKTLRFQDADLNSTNLDAKSKITGRNLFFSDKKTLERNGSTEKDEVNIENISNLNRCGIILERPEYYTIPSLSEVHKYKTENGSCLIKGFTIGHHGYGRVCFPDEIDVSNLNLDEIVHFRYRQITIYPDDDNKPPLGQELNRAARVTLEHVWPRDEHTHELIKDNEMLEKEQFVERLVIIAEKQDATFVDYIPETGTWTIDVTHFTNYKFSDEVDAIVKKDRIDKQQQQQLAAPDDKWAGDCTSKGLGGIQGSYQRGQESSFRSHRSHILTSASKDSMKTVIIMKSSFFDEDSLSDDMSSSEIGHPLSSMRMDITGPRTIDLQKITHLCVPNSFRILNESHVVPICKSLLPTRNYVDIGLFKGRSFKVGWGPGFMLASLPSSSAGDTYTINEFEELLLTNVVCYKIPDSKPDKLNVEEHLKIVLEESVITVDRFGVPTCIVSKGCDCLIRHKELSENDTIKMKQIWDLCLALWGPNATTPTRRIETFSKWLENSTYPFVKDDLERIIDYKSSVLHKIFIYLTGHQVESAVQLAMQENMPHLGVLLSQISSNNETRLHMLNQMEEWKKSDTFHHMDKHLLKIYMLLGGVPVLSTTNVFDGLDWIRTLAIHFWYMCPSGVSITKSVKAYQRASEADLYACKPIPDHYNEAIENDVLYNIMLLFGSRTLSLGKVLNPTTYSENPLDCRLSWLLLHSLLTLTVGVVSEKLFDYVNSSFLSQLENCGMWKWAIFIALWRKNSVEKTNTILDILCRHLDPERSPTNMAIEDSLVYDFKIPPCWIHLVLAYKTKSAQNYFEAFKHLTLVPDYNEAHALAMSHIVPSLIVNEQWNLIRVLFEPLAEYKNNITDWDLQIGLLLDLLDVKEAIYGIKDKDDINIHPIRHKFYSVFQRMINFPAESVMQRLATAELSKFIAVLMRTIYCNFLLPLKTNVMYEAVSFVSQSNMPPDYKTSELLYIFEFFKQKCR